MELQIIRAQEFVRLGAKGHFDLEASKTALAQLARACCKRGINQALLDLRALHPGPKPFFSPGDLVMLVNTFREIGFNRRQRLAVLYTSDPHGRAPMFTHIAKMGGWHVQAFKSFEQALHWLSGVSEPSVETEYTPTAKKVPVRHLGEVEAARKPAPQPRIVVKSQAGVPRASPPVNTGKRKAPASSTRAAGRPASRIEQQHNNA